MKKVQNIRNPKSLREELKVALHACRQTLTDFAHSLQKPDGSKGVSHTAVIRVAQGKEDTPWIRKAIKQKIRQAKEEYPKYYAKVSEKIGDEEQDSLDKAVGMWKDRWPKEKSSVKIAREMRESQWKRS